MLHDPPPVRWTVEPATLQLPLAAKLVTARLEDAVALTAKSGSPEVLLAREQNLIVWSAWERDGLAVAVFPVPPLVEVTLAVVLVYWPEAAPVTVTLNWHCELTAVVAPDSATPAGLVVVSVPPHTVAEELATVSPVGNVSAKATPVSGSTFAAGFVMVKVNDVVAFSAIVLGLNTLAIDGGASTLSEAEAVPPVPSSVEVTLPVVLVCKPAAVPVTLIENVQEELAASVTSEMLIEFDPATAVGVLPQVLPANPFGVATTRPAGNISLKPTPVSEFVVLLFWSVNCKLVEPLSGMLAAPNALMITGGATTVIDALEVLPVPPSVEVICTELFFTPVVVPCTSAETMQEAPPASVPPERLTAPEPPTAVAVPPQGFERFGVEATTKPAGRLSVNASAVRPLVASSWLMVKVKDDVPFTGMVDAAPNFLVMAGAKTPATSVKHIDTLSRDGVCVLSLLVSVAWYLR